MKTLEFYINAFQKLRRDFSHGGAPHKPILLLALIKAFDTGVYNSNKIEVSPELISYFKTYWSLLVTTPHKESFVLPFYHLGSEKSRFWRLMAKPGYQFALTASKSIKSFKALKEALNYVELDNELVHYLNDKIHRNILTEVLISKYFPEHSLRKVEEIKNEYYSQIQTQLFNDPPEEYARKVKELYLLKEGKDEKIDLDKYTRSEIFKREIPKVYNYTCAITGLRIDTTLNISMLDACHIIPFSESYDDTIGNGIALCPNMHRAFDRGLIAIDDNYRVLVSPNFMESYSHYSIKQYEGKEILLPKEERFWPKENNIKKQREKFNEQNYY